MSSEQNTSKHLITTTDAQEPIMFLTRYSAPQIMKEPTVYQHIRMFSDLISGTCPLMQAGDRDSSQQTYVQIKVNNKLSIWKKEVLFYL